MQHVGDIGGSEGIGMKKSGIYGIKNTANGKWYIGQTIDLSKRKYEHFCDLRNRWHHNGHLQSAWDKYGEGSFEFHVMEECIEGIMDVREREWIANHHSNQSEFGYNKETGGTIHKHHSDESKQKISAAGKGRHHSIESRMKMSKSCMGRRQSEDSKRKISESLKGNKCHLGCKHSEETKARIGDIGRGIKRSEEFKSNLSAYMKGRKNRLGMKNSDESNLKRSASLVEYHRRKNESNTIDLNVKQAVG